MSWVEQNKHHFQGDPGIEISRFLCAAGVDRALDHLSGPFGVRRFLVYFERQGRRILIQNIETLGLPNGGGAPPPDPNRQRMEVLEQALWRLHLNMSTGAAWKTGCLGFVRNCDNQQSIVPFFGEDREMADLSLLPVPPESHPLETPQYKRMLGSMEAQIEPVWSRTSTVSPEWDYWDVTGDELRLIFGTMEFPSEIRTHRCTVLATFSIRSRTWTWQVERPLFDEEIFCWMEFLATWDAAMELGVFCTARVGANWLFSGQLGDGDSSLLLAVWDT